MSIIKSSCKKCEDVALFTRLCKGGRKVFPFAVSHVESTKHCSTCVLPPIQWEALYFTTIKGFPTGKSFPKFFSVKLPSRILWYGIVASFDEKRVLIVVYFDAEKNCIAHACYLIQYDPDTYLTPSLYVTNQSSYESFVHLQVEDHFFSQEIKANRFEVDYIRLNSYTRTGRLSNDGGTTWSQFNLTLNRENMQVKLTLKS